MSDIIFSIIPIIISIPAFLVSLKTLKECKNLKCKIERENPSENNIEKEGYLEDSILYSMEFNTKIDGLIRSMLNIHPNEEIIRNVSLEICRQYSAPNDYSKVEAHVKDMLLNYNNKYEEKHNINVKDYINDTLNKENSLVDMPTMIDFNDKENLPSWYKNHKPDGDTRGVTNTEYTKSIDIKNVLNNFYND